MNEKKFEEFCESWLEEFKDEKNLLEKGRGFALKLFSQWLDIDKDSEDIIVCDGTGDGGIDLAYFQKSEDIDGDVAIGDTWYVVQSKYGKSVSTSTVLKEVNKLVDTLKGESHNISFKSQDFLEKIHSFISKIGENDRLIYVFATERPLTKTTKTTNRLIDMIKQPGIKELGSFFEVETISLETIYQRNQSRSDKNVEIPIKANIVPSNENLFIGSVALTDLYSFVKAYYYETQDLNQLYEHNIRLFLTMRGKVNKTIKKTIEETPENFGFYNNGITIAVEDIININNSNFRLVNPQIVNGCQTTETIYKVFQNKLDLGGKGENSAINEWKSKVDKGVVLVKIVKIKENEDLLKKITRYTNTQNDVKKQDFIALDEDFKGWKKEMEEKYSVYLEIQRGGWDSVTKKQKFTGKSANILDLIKIYGAGWLGEAGTAYGQHVPFAPGGKIYKRIMKESETIRTFDVDELYATYLLKKIANDNGFIRSTKTKDSRKSTRFLFYLAAIEMIKHLIINAAIMPDNSKITEIIIKISKKSSEDICNHFFDKVIKFIDEYMDKNLADSIYNESNFSNLNYYLKSDKMGKQTFSPNFYTLLGVHKRLMEREPWFGELLSIVKES